MNNKENLLSKEKTLKQNRIWVRISNSCNNNCIFCLDSSSQDGGFVKKEIVKKQIKDGYKSGYENRVIISGGEASIDPKFIEYIKYSKNIGYDRVQTITNGNMFASEKFCKDVFDAGLEEVTFSMHGHNSILHDYLVNTPGAFKKSIKGIIYIKKNYPNIILNIDVVVNKINIDYLPNIIKFFLKLGIYEYDILQIIPFGRGFKDNKNKLFYDIEKYTDKLQQTWKLSKVPGIYMWTNRFPVEAFEGYEDLIQDPRKIKEEVMSESFKMFETFITSNGEKVLSCYKKACKYCFLNQYCNDFIKNKNKQKLLLNQDYKIITGEEFPSQVYKKYGETKNDFENKLKKINKKLINIPKCLGGEGVYLTYNDIKVENSLEDYTQEFIINFYRKKSLRCSKCKYFNECEGIHINFIRSYGFDILKPIL